ncbi:MAG TPA: hypothetical protein VK864_18225 [Longimicrobiales bacterium]|nr:hypothetical protein [Longimicrobiales bacterium]
MAKQTLLTLACLLASAGCDSPVVVSPKVTVTVLSYVDSVRLLPSGSGGSHTVHCGVTYELLPLSKPVHWKDVAFQYHFGADRSQVDEQIYVPADTLERSWRTITRNGSALVGSRWEFGAPVPFSVTAEMQYSIEGESVVKTVRPRFSCGPEPTPADSAPKVSGFVTPLADLQRGSTLRINYQANSTLGLWETSIRITGAFTQTTRYPEDFRKIATREVTISIPIDATVGEPVHIAVSTTDAALLHNFITFTSAPLR